MKNRVAIGNYCQVKSGYAFKSTDWKEFGYPVIKIANIGNGKVSLEGCGRINDTTAELAKEYELFENDILITMTGEVGEVGRVRTNQKLFLNQRVGRFQITNPEKLNQQFLFYALSADVVKRYLQQVAYGTAQPNISPSLILSAEIHLPDLKQQNLVVDVLNSLDVLIENNTRRIEILEESAKALYMEWFVHYRYPGHENDTMVDSELGPIPKGWEIASLNEVCSVNKKSVDVKDQLGKILYVDIASVGIRDMEPPKLIDFDEAPSRARRVISDGDTIWSTVRPNRRSHIMFVDPPSNLICSTGFAVLSPLSVPESYLYELSSHSYFSSYLESVATGSAYPAVRNDDIKNYKFVLPSRTVLTGFHELSRPIHLLQNKLNLINNDLRGVRDLLLPRLISGELDVSDLDLVA